MKPLSLNQVVLKHQESSGSADVLASVKTDKDSFRRQVADSSPRHLVQVKTFVVFQSQVKEQLQQLH